MLRGFLRATAGARTIENNIGVIASIERRPRGTMTKHATSSLRRYARLALFTSLLLANACSREVPPERTSHSPASDEAEAAPAHDSTHSLDGDPPLPGESATGSMGLEQSITAPDHADHAGHAEPPTQSEPAPEPTPQPKPAPRSQPAPQPQPAPQSQPAPQPQPQPEPHTNHHDDGAHDQPKATHHHGH
jgi:hypothetical protein